MARQKQDKRIGLYLTEYQYNRMKAAAADALGLSEFIRRAIDTDLNSPANARRREARLAEQAGE